MAQLIDEARLTGTITGGNLNVDFSFALGVIVKQIIVTTSTDTTTFDVKIVDKNNDIVYQRDSEVGCLNELLDLPIKGSYTLFITNATADDSVVVKIIAHET